MSGSRDRQRQRREGPGRLATGDETMTGARAAYLKTLWMEAGEPFDPDLTKAEASKRIDGAAGEGRPRSDALRAR